MSKVIFLDIDGVFVTKEIFLSDFHHDDESCYMHKFHKPAVAALNKIVSETGAIVVISSSWRCMHTELELKDKFQREGAKISFHQDWRTIRIRDNDSIRGHEVSEWLSRHPEITKWACVDDDADFLPENNLFQTNFNTSGLTEEIADKIIAHLNS